MKKILLIILLLIHSSTIGYRINGKTTYALEGSIFIAGAAPRAARPRPSTARRRGRGRRRRCSALGSRPRRAAGGQRGGARPLKMGRDTT